MNNGKINQIIGNVVDVRFEEPLPNLFNALTVNETNLVLEVQQHIGSNVVRCLAMGTTDGLRRNMLVTDSGAPIQIPVGKAVLGRVLNSLGSPIDYKEAPHDTKKLPIHRSAPDFKQLKSRPEIFETGIKVIDLLSPFVKGGKIGVFGGAGVGKTVVFLDLI